MRKTGLIHAAGSLGLLAVACFREPALDGGAADDGGSSGKMATTSSTSDADDAASDDAGPTVASGHGDSSDAATSAIGSEGVVDDGTTFASSDTSDASDATSSSVDVGEGPMPLGQYGDPCDDGAQCESELCWNVMGTCTAPCEPWAANDCGAQGLTGFCLETEPPTDGACWGDFDSGVDGDDGYVDADDDATGQVVGDDLDIHTLFFAQAGWHWINVSRGFQEGTVELRLYDLDELFAIIETDDAGFASYEVYSPGVGTMHATVTAKDGNAATYGLSINPDV